MGMDRILELTQTSLFVMGLGMGIVFLVLVILWGVLELFRVVFYELPQKKAASQKPVEQTAAQPAAPITENKLPASDSELIAVFSAAIAADQGTTASTLAIRSYRRL